MKEEAREKREKRKEERTSKRAWVKECEGVCVLVD